MSRKLVRNATMAFALAVAIATPQLIHADDAAPATDDVFRLTLPAGYGAFAKKAQTVPSPEGGIKATNWVSKSPEGSAIVVTMSKMPGKIIDPEKLLTSTRDSLLKSLGATLETGEKTDVTLTGANLFFSSKSAYFRSQLLVSDDRFYQLLYVGRTPEERTSPTVAQLFESFAVNNPAAEPAAAVGGTH